MILVVAIFLTGNNGRGANTATEPNAVPLFQSSIGAYGGRVEYPVVVGTDLSGNVYVLDSGDSYGNNRVQKFDNDGNYLSQYTQPIDNVTGLAFSPSEISTLGSGRLDEFPD